uniref:Uncharacterized protein n=1 Tax=Ditylum brightwellii TaxID=49249 RepID=A0A7S2A0I2_9STRA|mmetsp:Transcript_6006/g.9115  ORF Transcript_6006/g.9115 Transcript_6006/m.9115 type:complete len:338 (+) Transcript_6006:134-1147(+)
MTIFQKQLGIIILVTIVINIFFASPRYMSSNYEQNKHHIATSEYLEKTQEQTNEKDFGKCLTFDEDLNELVSRAEQVFITMPAKSAGSSLKHFVNQCMNVDPWIGQNNNNFINGAPRVNKFMTDSLHLPKVIASHLYGEDTLLRLLQNTGRNTLLIYIHREETSRLLSAVKQVISRACSGNIPFDRKYDEVRVNGTHCEIDESFIVKEIIVKKQNEMRNSAGRILTCDVYDKIDDTAPKMVFLHYKQADKLQAIIAAHHCQDMLEKLSHQNIDADKKMQVSVVLEKSKTEVRLDEWIKAKGELLEWGYQLKEGEGCQAKTRHMEDKLLSCDDELLLI